MYLMQLKDEINKGMKAYLAGLWTTADSDWKCSETSSYKIALFWKHSCMRRKPHFFTVPCHWWRWRGKGVHTVFPRRIRNCVLFSRDIRFFILITFFHALCLHHRNFPFGYQQSPPNAKNTPLGVSFAFGGGGGESIPSLQDGYENCLAYLWLFVHFNISPLPGTYPLFFLQFSLRSCWTSTNDKGNSSFDESPCHWWRWRESNPRPKPNPRPRLRA